MEYKKDAIGFVLLFTVITSILMVFGVFGIKRSEAGLEGRFYTGAPYVDDSTFASHTSEFRTYFDNATTATWTRFLLYDVDNGQLERVSVGAADSGGAGYKVLRVPN